MISAGKIALLEAEPDLARGLSEEETRWLQRLTVPAVSVGRAELDVEAFLTSRRAFAAIVVDGLLLHQMAIGTQRTLRLLGPRDVLTTSDAAPSTLLSQSIFRGAGDVSLAVLDDRVLEAARRIPHLFARVQVRLGEQYQRLATQLAICQLSRVEDRLLALFWMLAESWGRVTRSGTAVSLTLTHDALGELVGARRPTVSLALKELSDRGALVRQNGDWLLLEPPPGGSIPTPRAAASPAVTAPSEPRWGGDVDIGPPFDAVARHETLRATVAEIRASQLLRQEEAADRLARVRTTRTASRLLRERIAADALSRRSMWQGRRPRP